MFLGICGGLGEYFQIDPSFLRILFVIFAFAGGSAIILYIILAFLLPLRPEGQRVLIRERKVKELARELKTGLRVLERNWKKKSAWLREKEREVGFREERRILGFSLFVFVFIDILNQFFPEYWFRWRLIWPISIILLGIYLVFRNKDFQREGFLKK